MQAQAELEILARKCQHLTRVALCAYSDDIFESPTSLITVNVRLETLSLIQFVVSLEFVLALIQLSSLRELAFDDCILSSELTTENLISRLVKARWAPSLTELIIRPWYNEEAEPISESSFRLLAIHMPRLETLMLPYDCQNERELMDLFEQKENFPNLKKLWTPLPSDDALEKFAR